jgi:hypothetical protein
VENGKFGNEQHRHRTWFSTAAAVTVNVTVTVTEFGHFLAASARCSVGEPCCCYAHLFIGSGTVIAHLVQHRCREAELCGEVGELCDRKGADEIDLRVFYGLWFMVYGLWFMV